jgi:dihydroflavonol-4-reductase
VPDWLVRFAARFTPTLGSLADLLGPPKLMSTDTATKLLGWQPRPAAETIVETAESLLRLGLIDK